MIYQNTTAIEAVNNGADTPDAFYHKSTLIATSKYVATDGWRGYQEVTPEPGYKEIDADWLTGDWDDAPAGHSESEVDAKTKALEREHGDIWLIFTPTSNVFSTSYSVIVRDKSTPAKPVNKGKLIAGKTRKFTEDDGSWRVRYHATDVVIYDANKQPHYTLNSGGWLTKTTKERINTALPSGYWISQKNFKWTVHTPAGDREFVDGMEV
jgi:hypothetical protein